MSAAADPRLRQKQPVGIAAGAEDAKYQAKYKELKRKVKDIEADNDKLHFKVLQAKLTIRRMKMERAILYERLTTIPPSPSLQDHHPLPPMSVMQGGGTVGPPHPALAHLRPPGGQPQHRDYPFHPSTSVDIDQQRLGGGPAPHIHAGHHPHHHHQHPSHSRSGDPRMNLTPGIDPRNTSVDNQPAASPPRLPVHSPPGRISSIHEGSIPRQSQHTIPPNSAPYESRGPSNIPQDNHHVHTSPASSHHNAQVGGSHSHKRSHSHSSPRTTHPHQIEVHPSAGHIHTAQPYRVLSSGPNNSNNPGHGSGTVTPAIPIGQQAHHQYPENLAPVQPPLNSPPLSEMEFERGGRSHHPHPHLHQQIPHQHTHAHSGGGGHQHPHSQHPHHHHVVHHHHQHNHPHSTQAQAHNEYGGGLPVGDPPTSSPAIQAHGAGYDTGGRGTVSSGPPVAASASGAPSAGSASGSGRTHAHPRERGAYDYPTSQPEGRRDRDRERDGGREREREKDADREWERERDRAREYSRGELINYSPPHHRTRSSQSRPLSRTHSQSHPASGGRSQSQTAVGHTSNPSGEYEHSASNSSRGRTAPSSAAPASLPGAHTPQAQYHSSPEDQPQPQAYRDYPPDPNTMYAPRLAPSSRAASPGVPSNAGSGSTVGHTSVGPDMGNNSGPRDRDREPQRDRGRQQLGPPRISSPASGAGDNDASEHNNQSQDSGRKRSRNEMEMEADEEFQVNNDAEGGAEGRGNGASGSGSGREVSLQPQDDSRGAKRYHRQADSSPGRERR